MSWTTRVSWTLAVLLVSGAWARGDAPQSPWQGAISVSDFLPAGFVTDGSVSYQRAIQKAIDTASQTRRALVFPPMTYLLDDEAGLSLHSGMTLVMYGATVRLDRENRRDGQALAGRDVTDVQILGGEIAGQREAWPDSVNIAGIRITGNSARIRIRDVSLHDLSSNGIGIFGAGDKAPIRDVLVENVLVRNCSNIYVDYLKPQPGPAPGSQREDQGGIACYYVTNFVVRDSLFEGSRSDGTHFFQCRDGRFTDNQVTGSTMGGYFLEGCQHVTASGNLIRENGSRGVTIERDSRFCTLVGNIVEHSGREGLWAPDVAGCVVADNVFRENGRKNHDALDSELKIEETDRWKTVTEDILIRGNLVVTTAHQQNALWITSGCRKVVVEGNSLRGPVRTVRVDPWFSGDGEVRVSGNDGWKTDSAGIARFSGDGKTRRFRIGHGLDFAQPLDPRAWNRISIVPTVVAGSAAAVGPFSVSTDGTSIQVEYREPPAAGQENVVLAWSVRLGDPPRPSP